MWSRALLAALVALCLLAAAQAVTEDQLPQVAELGAADNIVLRRLHERTYFKKEWSLDSRRKKRIDGGGQFAMARGFMARVVKAVEAYRAKHKLSAYAELPEGLTHALEACEIALQAFRDANVMLPVDYARVEELMALQPASNTMWEMNVLYEQGWKTSDFKPHVRQLIVGGLADVLRDGAVSDPHRMYAELFVAEDADCVSTAHAALQKAVDAGDDAASGVYLRLLCRADRATADEFAVLLDVPLDDLDECVDRAVDHAHANRDDDAARALVVDVGALQYAQMLSPTPSLVDFLLAEHALLTPEQLVRSLPALVEQEDTPDVALTEVFASVAGPLHEEGSELRHLLVRRIEEEFATERVITRTMWVAEVLAVPATRVLPLASPRLTALVLARPNMFASEQAVLEHAVLAAQPEALEWLNAHETNSDHVVAVADTLYELMLEHAQSDKLYAAKVAPVLLRNYQKQMEKSEVDMLRSVLSFDAEKLPKSADGLARLLLGKATISNMGAFLASSAHVYEHPDVWPDLCGAMLDVVRADTFDAAAPADGAFVVLTTIAVAEKRGREAVDALVPHLHDASPRVRDALLHALLHVARDLSADDIGLIMGDLRPLPDRLGALLAGVFAPAEEEGGHVDEAVRERVHAELLVLLDSVPECTESSAEVALLATLHRHLNRPELMWLLRRGAYQCPPEKATEVFSTTFRLIERVKEYEGITLDTITRVLSDSSRPHELLSDIVDGLLAQPFLAMPMALQERLALWAAHTATDPVQVARVRRMLPHMAVPMRHNLVKETDTFDSFARVKDVLGDLRVRMQLDTLLEMHDVGAAHLLTASDVLHVLKAPEVLDEDTRIALQTIRHKLVHEPSGGIDFTRFEFDDIDDRDLPKSLFITLPSSHRNKRHGDRALDVLEFVWKFRRNHRAHTYGNRDNDLLARHLKSRTLVARRRLVEQHSVLHPLYGTYHGFEVEADRSDARFVLRTIRGKTEPKYRAGLALRMHGKKGEPTIDRGRIITREDSLVYVDPKADSRKDVVGLTWLHDMFDQTTPQILVDMVTKRSPGAWMSVVKETRENANGIDTKNGGVTKGERVTRWCSSNPRARGQSLHTDVHRIEATEGGRISSRRWMLKTRNIGGTYNSQVFTEGTDDTIVTVVVADAQLPVQVTLSSAEMEGMRASTREAIKNGKLDKDTKLPSTTYSREYSSSKINFGQMKSLLQRGYVVDAKVQAWLEGNDVFKMFEEQVGLETLVDFSLRSTLHTQDEKLQRTSRGVSGEALHAGKTTLSARDQRGNRIVLEFGGNGERSAIYEPATGSSEGAQSIETYWTLGSDDGKWSKTYRMRMDEEQEKLVVEAFNRQQWTKEPLLTEYVLRARAFKEAMFVASDADNIVPLLKFLTRTASRITRVASRVAVEAAYRMAPLLDVAVNPLAGAAARHTAMHVDAATKKLLSQENSKRFAEKLSSTAHPRATGAMAGLAGLMVVMDVITLYESIKIGDAEGAAGAVANVGLDFATMLMSAARFGEMTGRITQATMSKCLAFGTSLAVLGAAVSVVLGVYQLTQGNFKGGAMSIGYGVGCAVSMLCGPVGWVIAAGLAVMQLVFDAQTHLHTTRIAAVRVDPHDVVKEAKMIELTFHFLSFVGADQGHQSPAFTHLKALRTEVPQI